MLNERYSDSRPTLRQNAQATFIAHRFTLGYPTDSPLTDSQTHQLVLLTQFNAWIEPAIQNVCKEIGKDDGECNHKKDTLHHSVITTGNAVK